MTYRSCAYFTRVSSGHEADAQHNGDAIFVMTLSREADKQQYAELGDAETRALAQLVKRIR